MICLVGLMGESHMRMKALFTLFFLDASHAAFAEGGCPAGQYPIGGQGVQGCAPIPSAGSGGGDLRPNGRWIKTWGGNFHVGRYRQYGRVGWKTLQVRGGEGGAGSLRNIRRH